ncbi:SRPBCC domain-containing protein [Asanoa sp. WMMD1127]|uniref:SRPBCC family protein n=1 Tax=Asanoa sp. WMMD1127 TaxID=3016107 RepID=UPI002417DFBA|nr:SRPBCC domain-containing protein [Asanoa sp. WMMD1127]MDG4826134.1 SRPBCC domain-containing protein [Asanoa sp. WMMD1127]
MRVSMPSETDALLRITVDVPGVSPAQVVDAFVDPAAVRLWWGGAELTVKEEVGGPYVAYFDRLDQTMRGTVTTIDPGRGRFGFDWSWDHAPQLPRRHVEVTVDQGAVLNLAQGDYDLSSQVDRDEAQSHRDGWEFFLPRLAEVVRDRS